MRAVRQTGARDRFKLTSTHTYTHTTSPYTSHTIFDIVLCVRLEERHNLRHGDLRTSYRDRDGYKHTDSTAGAGYTILDTSQTSPGRGTFNLVDGASHLVDGIFNLARVVVDSRLAPGFLAASVS
ncbi:unnamed protein product [Danaus chrysippus]|uniref:(African queen) hypothetical protein n=1 Tax=Danaus chrysippus TaxID=151541 RepID=A0A8J2QWQ4_9NEOP|nr:unnamed protein product [Danaus chrysippus]